MSGWVGLARTRGAWGWLRKGTASFETLPWYERDGMYHSHDLVWGQITRVHTGSSALPLFADVPGPERAAQLADGFFSACPFGEPDVCASVPSYHEPKGGSTLRTTRAARVGERQLDDPAGTSELSSG
jgi:hypothetical protein